MALVFVDPRAEPGAAVDPYELRADLSRSPLTIGLLANGFPDSVAFLNEVRDALAEALPHASFRCWDKGDASSVASPQMLDEIVGSCQVAIAAYGH